MAAEFHVFCSNKRSRTQQPSSRCLAKKLRAAAADAAAGPAEQPVSADDRPGFRMCSDEDHKTYTFQHIPAIFRQTTEGEHVLRSPKNDQKTTG
jgi:hypothetical protein